MKVTAMSRTAGVSPEAGGPAVLDPRLNAFRDDLALVQETAKFDIDTIFLRQCI